MIAAQREAIATFCSLCGRSNLITWVPKEYMRRLTNRSTSQPVSFYCYTHKTCTMCVFSNDAEFLWRLARASRDLSLLSNMTAEEKKRLTFEAFECAKKALENNEASFAAHKWYAVCLSDIGDYGGIKVKIGNSYIIKHHLEKAIELNPKDATSIHIMGHWCFAFAELPWYQRKVAAMIFASPPTSTFEEALAFFLKAEEVDPNFYSKNLLMLGKTYMAMKDKESAVQWLIKARDYTPHTEEDKEVNKEAIKLLKNLTA